jgi:carbohydrate-binding DOMON domain-containing protein
MKVRTAIGGTARRARLTAAGCGTLALLGIVTLSACTSSPSSPPVASYTITSSQTASAGVTSTSIATSTSTQTVTPTQTTTTTVTPTQTTTATVTPTATVSPSPSPIPTQAPVTGGGGTAGFQDGVLLAVGAAAIVAGAGSIAYRRRLTRKR